MTVPQPIPTGAVRYNTDSNKMEVWIGDKWMQVAVSTPNLDGGARGIVMGGNPGTNRIDFFTISTAGDATDFGDANDSVREATSAGSNHTRGLTAGGYSDSSNSNTDRIGAITFSTTGNAADFGNLNEDLYQGAACASRERAVHFGGRAGSPTNTNRNTIQFVTIASTGNAQDFGDTTDTRYGHTSLSNQTRGLCTFGQNPVQNNIEYVTIQSTGNSIDYGDLTDGGRKNHTSCASPTRGLFFAGRDGSNNYENNIE